MTNPLRDDNYFLPGTGLFDQAMAFYSEYATWDAKPGERAKNLKNLSIIMRISKAKTPTPSEEESAIGLFVELREGLHYGNIRIGEVSEKLGFIRRLLTEKNPRSNTVGHIMEIDYRNRIRPNTSSKSSDEESIIELGKALDAIVDEIKHGPDIRAQALSQELSALLTNPPHIDKLLSSLKRAISLFFFDKS